jgi:hypothetical protein
LPPDRGDSRSRNRTLPTPADFRSRALSRFQQSATFHLAKEPRFVPVELAETLVHAPDNVLAGWRPEQLERLRSHQNRASEVRLSHEFPASFSSSVRIV